MVYFVTKNIIYYPCFITNRWKNLWKIAINRAGKYVIPVEVKAGKSGTLKSLHQFMNMSDHKYAVRLYSGNLEISEVKTTEGKEYKLLNLPYFLAGKIHEYLDWFID